MNRNAVSYLLVGGLNYFLAHKPVTTQDIDLLIDEAKEESISFQVDNDLQIQLISARDLLECQMALPEIYRKPERIHYLRGVVEND